MTPRKQPQGETRLFDLLERRKRNAPTHPVFNYKENGEWKKHYIDEYIEKANLISYALLHLGVQRGENVALISTGRPEWNYIDMGVQQIGAVLVPIYPTISEEDYLYILNHCEVRYIFLESKELLRKIKNILPKLERVQKIYTIVPCDTESPLEELYQLGKEHPAAENVIINVKTQPIVVLINVLRYPMKIVLPLNISKYESMFIPLGQNLNPGALADTLSDTDNTSVCQNGYTNMNDSIINIRYTPYCLFFFFFTINRLRPLPICSQPYWKQ